MKSLRNIAIIAHVDHGKTTLVDCLLQQSGTLDRKNAGAERIMDSNDQERERGITILAKNTAITWNDYRINIVDTPGHADFGGEVERVLSMVDSVLLLVDAVDGPMPQTRFVTAKAFERGLNPIVVVNKIDRPGARPDWVIDQVFDLFDTLGATEEQLDFPVIYASAINGIAGEDYEAMAGDMSPLFQAIVDKVAPPEVNADGPLQLQISALDYSSYVGVIGVGRITRGELTPNTPVAVVDREGNQRKGKVLQVMGYLGLERVEAQRAEAGDIVCVTGIDALNISDTLCDPASPEALPALTVDEPTVSMTFQVNDSPFAGREGKYVTSRNIKERLERELIHNVALRVEQGDSPDKFKVSGRGELHLSVLIENMRREGFEVLVSRPTVITKTIDGVEMEPFETLWLEFPDDCTGGIMENLSNRKGKMTNMDTRNGTVFLEAEIPTRGLIGLEIDLVNATSGHGIMSHLFKEYRPKAGEISTRLTGTLVSMDAGKTTAYSLNALEDRGKLFVEAGTEVYEGMIVGENPRASDIPVNPTKAKQLTNFRSQGEGKGIQLSPPIEFSLERAIEYIAPDEFVEATPSHLRLRKRILNATLRKRAARV